MLPILAILLSLLDIIRRFELSLSPGHPTLLLHYAALGAALMHCVLLAMAAEETIAAFLFVAVTAMQCAQLLLYCTLSAADLALTLETHLQSMPAAIGCFMVLGGSQGWCPFLEEARCGRSLATFLALQAFICLVLYLRTAMLEALTVILPCSTGAFALAFGLAHRASRVPHAVQYRRVVHQVS